MGDQGRYGRPRFGSTNMKLCTSLPWALIISANLHAQTLLLVWKEELIFGFQVCSPSPNEEIRQNYQTGHVMMMFPSNAMLCSWNKFNMMVCVKWNIAWGWCMSKKPAFKFQMGQKVTSRQAGTSSWAFIVFVSMMSWIEGWNMDIQYYWTQTRKENMPE